MNYEEKYKNALERAVNLFVTNNISATAACEIFPELNESEEINYEKKYKKALEWMRSLYSGLHGATKEDAEHYFPELKESKDEQIRREIRNFIWGYPDKLPERDKWLAWFEKQYKTLDADRVIAWLKTHGNLTPIVTIKINEVIAKFKKDFGLC